MYPARKIIFSHRLSKKFTSQVAKKVDVFFLLFHYIFVYYPPLIRLFLLFSCQFSVASLINISQKNFLTLPERCRYRVNYSFKIYIKEIFFFSSKKVPVRRTGAYHHKKSPGPNQILNIA